MEAIQVSPVLLASVPIVIGVVSVFKGVGLPSKWAPIISLVLGLGVSFLVGGPLLTVILAGLIVGLSASGLYSGSKATFTG